MIGKLLKLLFPNRSEPWRRSAAHTPRTYLLPLDGVQAFVLKTSKSGVHITLSGWTLLHHRWCPGDHLILRMRGGLTTRYTLKEIRRATNHSDQYFADCVFNPRGEQHAARDDQGPRKPRLVWSADKKRA